MRRAAKRDASEPDIVKLLRGLGCSVYALSAKDLPDLLIGLDGETILAECKLAEGKGVDKRQTRLRPGQQDFQDSWRGGPVVVLRSVDDALRLVSMRRPRLGSPT